MNKKKREIYEIRLSEIVSWNDENDFPEEMNPIVSIDGKGPSFTTASINEAYSYYREHRNDDLLEDSYFELMAREIEVTDKEWMELLDKENLEYNDYYQYLTENNLRALAWNYSYKGHYDSDDSALDELLVVQSENFNMRVICEKAGISYSTYRGFKNNKQPFSRQKIYELLRTMNRVGNDSWDDGLEREYNVLKKRVKNWS